MKGSLLAGFFFVVPFATAEVSYNQDIRPIFTKNCTACHGGVKAAGGISFIYKDKALAAGKSGRTAIVPGKPEESELMRRVLSTDPEEVMPKPDHGAALPKSDTDTLRRWIQEGAHWEEHWSFLPPVDHPEPKVMRMDWPKSSLDHFILARREQEGLQPSAAAPPQEWLRRVSLDLIGLPPTLEEWADFEKALSERSSSAREEVVDRLLRSPHFGERWAAMWLDLARYADTQGYEKDGGRVIWPFRDWVIRAFNEDMPFDQFTIRQLAGDLLPKPVPGDRLATAFHRNTWTNTEGGTDDEEFRVAAVMDRVSTTWTAWMATTFRCTQCHAHPYDPFPHEDYYRFAAFFDNTEDCDLDNEYPLGKMANDPAKQAKVDQWQIGVREKRAELNRQALAKLEGMNWEVLRAKSMTPSSASGSLSQEADGTIVAGGTNPTKSAYTIRFGARPLGALRLQILPKSADPKNWSELASVASQIRLAIIGPDGQRREWPIREVIADHLAGPFDPNDSLNPDPGGFGDYPVLRGPRWCVLVPEQVLRPNSEEQIELTIHHAISCNGNNQPSILRRFRVEGAAEASLADYCADQKRLADWSAYKELTKRVAAIPGIEIPIVAEREHDARRDTRVFLRGNRMTKDKAVQAGIPMVSRPPSKTEGLTRLDMAQWLVGESNTLTARVLANRLWAELFGRGIVETLEDFGTSGVPPTHPELLDHLAIRLAKIHRWRIKPFLKELVLSAAYGQSNKADQARLAKDPSNRLLSRGPRTRLSAEMLRDQSLLLSGLLSRKQYGAPVFPPQPDGVWRTVYNGGKWETSQGEDRYRRAVYTFWKRTSAYPAFLTFDMTARDICTPRRVATNTPLHALVTLNDPAFLEMAQSLAKRMRQASQRLDEQLGFGLRLYSLGEPDSSSLSILRALYEDTRDRLAQDLAESEKLASTPSEAAMVIVANTLMNTDSALSK